MSYKPVMIMGVDPGLANTGWGVVEAYGPRLKPVAYGCISTPAEMPLGKRLARLYSEILAVIERYEPQQLSIEEIYFGSNTKSAIATAQARGAVMAAVGALDLELGEYTPMQIKKSVAGTGTADKAQVQYMVKAILKLDHEPHPDHAADALAACICHARNMMMGDITVTTRNTRSKHKNETREAWETVLKKRLEEQVR